MKITDSSWKVGSPWKLAGWLLVTMFVVLIAAQWPNLPYFLDSYYHLSVIEGFRQAGGPTLRAFWESAPQGRPHLYPPLFHLLFLPGLIAGIGPISLAKLWSWAVFPALMAGLLLVVSRMRGWKPAVLTGVAFSVPYAFFLSCVNNPPASLALLFFLGTALALHRQKAVPAGIFLGLAFWSHAGLPWLFSLGLLLFAAAEPSRRKTTLGALAIGLCLAIPWLLQIGLHRQLIALQPRGQDRMPELPLVWLALGLAGIIPAWKARGISRLWPALWIAFIPMAFFYPYRFWTGQGIFPALMLAGFALERLRAKTTRLIFFGLLAALAILSPSMAFQNGRPTLSWAENTPLVLSGIRPDSHAAIATALYNPRYAGELTREIEAHTRPDELIYCNLNYMGGMLSSLTGRACTNQMLREMADRPANELIPPARLVIWLKNREGNADPAMEQSAVEFHLRPLVKTELAYLYYNENARGVKEPARAVMPWWLAFGIAAAGIVGAVALTVRRS